MVVYEYFYLLKYTHGFIFIHISGLLQSATVRSSIHQFSKFRVTGGMELVPVATGREAWSTLDRLPSCRRAHCQAFLEKDKNELIEANSNI